MDVFGEHPTTEAGEYFCNNVWWWSPLWNYCEMVAPELCSKVKNGYSNDGDGLGKRDSEKLAAILENEMVTGCTVKFAMEYTAKLKALPDEPCEICSGTGKRAEPPNIGPGNVECNGCNGTGKRRPFSANYPFSVDNVREFAEFLKGCGGFKIC